MNIKLPIKNKRQNTITYKNFNIDTSLASQYRYEIKFPELAKREDLLSYSERICAIKDLSAGKILSELKLIYCWMDIDIEFIDFVKMFDFTDAEYIKELLETLQKGFDSIFDASAEKN